MRFTVNETASGVVNPPKDICKVQGCTHLRITGKRGYAFCKDHSGLKRHIPKKKYKELISNNQVVVL